MADPIRIQIRGSDADSDAPTVEDFLEQIKDLVALLHDVEKAIDPTGKAAIEWRVTKATTNSPIAIEATPFSRDHVTYIEPRAREVARHTAFGLNQLRLSAHRPPYFNEAMVGRAKRLSQRVTGGLALTEVAFGHGEPDFVLTPQTAAVMFTNTEKVLAPPKARAYREAGSIEGYFGGIAHDGLGRAVMTLRSRVSGEDVKCILKGEAYAVVRRHQIAEVLDGRRLRVSGTIFNKGPRRIDHVEATRLEFLRPADELPNLADISDPGFTGGMTSEDYLEALRDGRLN